ncbi:Sodium-dependent phosphate transporter [Candidatus Rhodobacter oscarellae]|uniref:Sodium-dependent phosphate transporter n=2 Tax=Candidatus Rhodobacter oscarellae TaxID=1675527 RepID=A0A0J9E1F2_9RHOB|nr:Sodium-dependent phosphate transporter [Candidatus Rhodobacter lobularis]
MAAFVSLGTLGMPAGLALLLGADLGSAIAARILLAPIGALIPFLLVIGVPLYLSKHAPKRRQAGRILVGLALVLLALGLIRDATVPLREAKLVGDIVEYLGRDLYAAFLIGAVLAWAVHSSVAAVLMIVTFAAEGMLPAQGAAALVLGANLGGSMIPFTLTLSEKMDVRRIVVANLLARGVGAAVVLFALNLVPSALGYLGETAGGQAINLHLAYNLGVVLLGLPVLSLLLKMSAFFVRVDVAEPAQRTSALDDRVLDSPDQALACATREIIRMGETVVDMAASVVALIHAWQPQNADQIGEAEQEVDELHLAIKLYVAQIQKAKLTEQQSKRAMELAKIAGNLEEAANLVSGNLVDLARKLSIDGLSFSDAGLRELSDFHARVLANLQLSLNVLVTSDADASRQLVEEKDMVRAEEQRLQKRHLRRLRKGNMASIETTNIHQEALRVLKQINALFAYVGYPIVEDTGDLLSSRLLSRPNQ